MSVLVFGEMLWDKFADKSELGGAPLNFACHYSLLGGKPIIISAVGDDADGKRAVTHAQKYGVDVTNVAVTEYDTGYCLVTLDADGTPSYNLVSPVAYDMIPYPTYLPEYDGLYFGTLAARCEKSKSTLIKLLKKSIGKEIFFDINIRQNYYSKELLEETLPYATVLKVSREEAHVFTDLGIAEGAAPEELCTSLYEKYKYKQIIVTLDKDGAAVFDGKRFIYSEKPHNKAVSTVGAGDSFSACYFKNYLDGCDTHICLKRAVTLSDYIVTVLGAVCEYPPELKGGLGID